MKPIIIWMEDKDSTKVTKEELEKILEQAYNQGYELGYSAGRAATITTTPSLSSPPTITPHSSWITTNPPYIPCTTCPTITDVSGSGTQITLKG